MTRREAIKTAVLGVAAVPAAVVAAETPKLCMSFILAPPNDRLQWGGKVMLYSFDKARNQWFREEIDP